MKEILGNNLEQFFNTDINGKCTYKGREYEVWEVSNKVFNAMCDMSEEEFEKLAGKYAWWRSAKGSTLGIPDTTVYINGHEILVWGRMPWDYDEEDKDEIYASHLTNYLCDVIGVSQPRNVCALAVDLAKYNNMTLGELFTKYEG